MERRWVGGGETISLFLTCNASDTRVFGPIAAFRASAIGYSMNSAYESAPYRASGSKTRPLRQPPRPRPSSRCGATWMDSPLSTARLKQAAMPARNLSAPAPSAGVQVAVAAGSKGRSGSRMCRW